MEQTYEYVPDFLTKDEADALFRACARLEFPMRKNPRNPKAFIRHQTVAFTEKPSKRASYAGDVFPLAQAPMEIQDLASKLTAYIGNGRVVNYLSVVRYRDGKDHINWHQHREDKGHDTPVLIVTTGAERNFSIREKEKPETAQHFVAQNGSLIVLSSAANDTHEHAVLDDKSVTAPRYAINCKCIGDAAPPTAALARIERARAELAEARTFAEFKDIGGRAAAMRDYAKRAHLGREAQNYAAEIALEAARKAGEILNQIKAPVGRPENNSASVAEYRQTLKDANTPLRTAQSWQELAEIPEPVFQEYIAVRKTDGEITAAGLLREVARRRPTEETAIEELRRRVHQILTLIPFVEHQDHILGRLTVRDGVARLTACGTQSTLEVILKRFNCKAPPSVLFELEVFDSILKKLGSADDFRILTAGDRVLVAAGAMRAELFDHARFEGYTPEYIENYFRIRIPEKPTAEINLALFQRMIKKVAFAVVKDDGKYIVTTALLHSTGEQIRLVSTDGHRMAIASYDCNMEPFSLHIPEIVIRPLKELTGDTIRISESQERLYFQTDLETLVVGKTAGAFPPYERVLPTVHKTQITVDADMLRQAIQRLAPIAHKETHGITLSIAENQPVILTLDNPATSYGQVIEKVDAIITGAPLEIRMNASFMLDFLKQATGEVVINATDAARPMDFHNGSYRYMQAPLQGVESKPFVAQPEKKTETPAAQPQAAAQPAEVPQVPGEPFLPDLKAGDDVVVRPHNGVTKLRRVEKVGKKFIYLASDPVGGRSERFERNATYHHWGVSILHIATDEDRQQIAAAKEESDRLWAEQQEAKVKAQRDAEERWQKIKPLLDPFLHGHTVHIGVADVYLRLTFDELEKIAQFLQPPPVPERWEDSPLFKDVMKETADQPEPVPALVG